jgi:LuxR family maltose regulon positive regulatory protein
MSDNLVTTAPLLMTKVRVPMAPEGTVSRPRLARRLTEGLGRKLTLLSAPPGYGKTTLLAEWARSCGRPVAWLSLETRDNDPGRFLAYLAAALHTVEADIGRKLPRVLQGLGPIPPEDAAALLINDIEANGQPLVMVLDDYHLVESEPIHEMTREVLEHMPPILHLVIATRADPPLPLARLRGRGQLNEFRQADLCFTQEETALFLNGSMRLGLSPDDVGALAFRTEGWITGLQMAALSLQGRNDAGQFVREFAGNDRIIVDYLVEEVLQRQTPELQEFLLRTSILDRMTGSLCDALTGAGNSESLLEKLERGNLFVVPLDSERKWYRYHRLFADLLLQRLRHSQPEAISKLHLRSSVWFEENEYPAEAIDHALAGGDVVRAAGLIESVAEATLKRSEAATLMRWVDALPREVLKERTSLLALYGLARLVSGRSLDEATALLEARAPEDAKAAGRLAALRASLAAYRGHLEAALELSEQALRDLPDEDGFLKSALRWIRTAVQLSDGDLGATVAKLDAVARGAEEHGNVVVAASAWCDVASAEYRRGRIREARAIYLRILEIARDAEGHFLPVATEALVGLGEVMRETNELEAAMTWLEQGMELAERWNRVLLGQGYVTLSRIRQSGGDWEGARRAIEEARRLAARTEVTSVDDLIADYWQAQLRLAQGDLDGVERWGKELGLDRVTEADAFGPARDMPARIRRYQVETWARLLVARGRLSEGLTLIGRLISVMAERGRIGRTIDLLGLQAVALHAQGELGEAMVSLERALALAEPEGYIRTFVEAGPRMAKLLHEAKRRGIHPEYASRLLAAFPPTSGKASGMAAVPGLVEPLSDRELEVLRLIAGGLSNHEIAARLVLAAGTVKTHTRNIFGKLGVNSRTQAVAEARKLGIL